MKNKIDNTSSNNYSVMRGENVNNDNNNNSNLFSVIFLVESGTCTILPLPYKGKEIVSNRHSVQVKQIKYQVCKVNTIMKKSCYK